MAIKSDFNVMLSNFFELADIDNDVFSITQNHIIRTIDRHGKGIKLCSSWVVI